MSIRPEIVRFLARGRWGERQVSVTSTTSSRRQVPEVEEAIEKAWCEVNARPGVTLFDGPVCRLEAFSDSPVHLGLYVSETSYRINVGTNFCHPEFLERFGREVMANPVGVSAGLVSSDGYLLMGRRNGSVAYYPHKLHPFAGSLEVRDRINLFDDVRRELQEEVHLAADQVTHMECVGIVEDRKLLHPETIFYVRSSLCAARLQEQVMVQEHMASQAIVCSPESLRAFSLHDDVTPVGAAVAIRLAEILEESPAA